MRCISGARGKSASRDAMPRCRLCHVEALWRGRTEGNQEAEGCRPPGALRRRADQDEIGAGEWPDRCGERRRAGGEMGVDLEPRNRRDRPMPRLDPQSRDRVPQRRRRVHEIKREPVTEPPEADRECEPHQPQDMRTKYLVPDAIAAFGQGSRPDGARPGSLGCVRKWASSGHFRAFLSIYVLKETTV